MSRASSYQYTNSYNGQETQITLKTLTSSLHYLNNQYPAIYGWLHVCSSSFNLESRVFDTKTIALLFCLFFFCHMNEWNWGKSSKRYNSTEILSMRQISSTCFVSRCAGRHKEIKSSQLELIPRGPTWTVCTTEATASHNKNLQKKWTRFFMRFGSDTQWSQKNHKTGFHFRGPIISGHTNKRYTLSARASQTNDNKSKVQTSLNTPLLF